MMLSHVGDLLNTPLRPIRQPVTLQVVDSYSGFVPNQIFEECRPFELMTYAVVQYLSFFLIKCSPRNISKNVNLSGSPIKKALNFLRKRRFIVKQDDGTYLFRKLNLYGSTELVDAREFERLHLGYWFPVDILKSKRISNQTKRAFALIMSLIESGQSRIDMNYIAQKLDLPRCKVSPLIGRLLSERLIGRSRPHYRSVYIYEVGEKSMSSYKKDLSTPRGDNRVNSDPVSRKGTPEVTSFSINKSNISIRDSGKDKSRSDTYEMGENKTIFLLKKEENRLNIKYTEACNDENWERMREIGSELSVIEVAKLKLPT